MNRVLRRRGDFHGKCSAVRIGSPHAEPLHIVYHLPVPEPYEPLRVRKGVHMNVKFTACIGPRFDLSPNVGPLPLIPVGDVRKLRLAGFRGQFIEFTELPGFAAGSATQAGSFRFHPEFGLAGRALIEHLLQAFRAFFIARPESAFLLPGVVVILEGFHQLPVYLLRREPGKLFRRKEAGKLCFGRFNPALMQVPKRRSHMISVADQGHNRNL